MYNDTLYFASDRPGGLGGLDIYKTFVNEEGEWQPPINLKAPINSNEDDFGLVIDPRTQGNELKGYFSSSRKGGAGKDDIYSFIRTKTDESVLAEQLNQPPVSKEIIDFQNDGRMDILIASYFENAIKMYTNAGNDAQGLPKFNNNGFYPLTNAISLTVGDFNQDNKQDYAAVGLGYTGFVTFHNETVIVSVDDLHYNTWDINLYPSLVSHKLTIQTQSDRAIDQVTIFNLSGQAIYHQQVADITTTIDCSPFTLGSYFARVTDMAGKTKTIRFVKVD